MENTTLNQAVLSTLKSDSKGFVISSTEAIAKAEAIAKVIEQFISSKLIKARSPDGKTMDEYRDEVADAWQNAPDEVTEAITSGVTEGVLAGEVYKDKVVRMYDNGSEYVDPDIAEVSAHKQGKDFNPDDIKSFGMSYILAQNWQALSYAIKKDGTTSNPMGSYGMSFKKLANDTRTTCKNTIDQNVSRIKGRIVKYLASTYGLINEEVDPVDEIETKSLNWVKSQKNLVEKLSSAKQQKIWTDAVSQCDEILTKAIASLK